MSSELLTELDNSFSHTKIDVSYPHIVVDTKNTAPLPVVLSLMDKGDIPILYSENGVSYELARVAKSALNLHRLMRVYPFTFVRNPESTIYVDNTTSLMEALKWTQQ